MKKETDEASRERLEKIEKELEDLKEGSDELLAQWKNEKEAIARLRQLNERIEVLKNEEQIAERDGNLEKAAEIRYGTLVAAQKQLEEENQRFAEIQKDRTMLKEEVDEEDIAQVVAAWTGVPVSRLMEGEMAKLAHLEEQLHKRVVGQDEAVTAVAGAIRRSRAGLSDQDRPLGSFIFMGPTGVGKTELAKALAEFLFDDERSLVRIDMSEYMEKFSVQRLIGAPPGFVGYEEGGQLTEAVRRRPYSVVLLDEIEKAHPDVFNILLQVLDDGRLTDGQGRTVSFLNTILIMTSNVGSQFSALIEQGNEEEAKRLAEEALRATFRPEFLNRVDDIVVFRQLTMSEIESIVDLQLEKVRARLAERKIAIELTPAAVERIGLDGFDPVFGARPLKRVIKRQVVDAVAKSMIEGTVREGSTVTVDVGDDGEIAVRV